METVLIQIKNIKAYKLLEDLESLDILKVLKKDELNHQMELAVNELHDDYRNDKELTAFTALDFEHFYETR